MMLHEHIRNRRANRCPGQFFNPGILSIEVTLKKNIGPIVGDRQVKAPKIQGSYWIPGV